MTGVQTCALPISVGLFIDNLQSLRENSIAVFGSDMTTEIAQELENNQVLKAVVDISGKKMGNAVFAQTLKVINKQADGEKVIQVPIDLYTKTEDGKQWLATHVDGLP